MSRTRKPASPDLKALEHIPAVREALRFVGLELVVRPLQASVVSARPSVQPAAPQSHAEVQANWAAQADVDAALAAEMGTPAPPKPKAELPAGQRRAIEKGFLRDLDGSRAAKLEQFKPWPTTEPDAAQVVDTQELTTLSEAT